MADEIEHPAILAGDRDRDAGIELLRSAVAEGRLALEEFSERGALLGVVALRDDEPFANERLASVELIGIEPARR